MKESNIYRVKYDEIMDENNISEGISSHQNPAESIDHTCDDNGINLFITE